MLKERTANYLPRQSRTAQDMRQDGGVWHRAERKTDCLTCGQSRTEGRTRPKAMSDNVLVVFFVLYYIPYRHIFLLGYIIRNQA